jgi:DNA-binding response OmpR family regulator
MASRPDRPCILIVEDDPDTARLLGLVCHFLPCTSRMAGTLGEARAIVATAAVDAVLLNLVLPDGNGLDLCREVKASRPALPVIVVTAAVAPEREAEVRTAGADLFVAKPFDPDALAATIERLLKTTA